MGSIGAMMDGSSGRYFQKTIETEQNILQKVLKEK